MHSKLYKLKISVLSLSCELAKPGTVLVWVILLFFSCIRNVVPGGPLTPALLQRYPNAPQQPSLTP